MIKAVSDTVLATMNAVYHDKPLVFIGAVLYVLREKMFSGISSSKLVANVCTCPVERIEGEWNFRRNFVFLCPKFGSKQTKNFPAQI